MSSSALVPRRRGLRTSLGVLAAGLKSAREAADDVPIVKQILGTVLLIVEYAEKADKNKDDMRALAEKSATLAQQIPAAVAGRTVDGQLSVHLERLKEIFTSIEKFMANVASGGRFRRVLKQLFVVGKEVENLGEQLEDAIEVFFFVAALDTRLAVQENAQYVGEFRVVRQCDVRKEGNVFHELRSDDDLLSAKFTRARVFGELMVVRYSEEACGADRQTTSDEFRWRILQHETLLQKLSTVQMSHPNLAQLYGFGRGRVETRFTVVRSGYHPARRFLRSLQGDETITNTSSAIIWKVLDAMSHLELNCGVAWRPGLFAEYIFLDGMGEPTIGLDDDLVESASAESQHWAAPFETLLLSVLRLSQSRSRPCSLLDAIRELPDPANEQDRRLLQFMVTIVPISAASFDPSCYFAISTLAQIAAPALLRVQEYLTDVRKKHGDHPYIGLNSQARVFLTLLHMLATGNQNDRFEVFYNIGDHPEARDYIRCYRVLNFGDTVLFRGYAYNVPKGLELEARSILGLSKTVRTQYRVFYAEFPPSPGPRPCTQSFSWEEFI